LKILNSLMNYPRNKIFLLRTEGNQAILAKITSRNFEILTEKKKKVLKNSNTTAGETIKDGSNLKVKDELDSFPELFDQYTSLFLRFYEGIQLDENENPNYTLPEKLARHLAERFGRFNHVLDAYAGIGSQAIQVKIIEYFLYFAL
jgi:hypothetical protein